MKLFKKSGEGKHAKSGSRPRTDAELKKAAELFVPGSEEERKFVEAMNSMGKMRPGRSSSSSDRIPHPDASACARGHDIASDDSSGRTVLSCRRPGCGYVEGYRP